MVLAQIQALPLAPTKMACSDTVVRSTPDQGVAGHLQTTANAVMASPYSPQRVMLQYALHHPIFASSNPGPHQYLSVKIQLIYRGLRPESKSDIHICCRADHAVSAFDVGPFRV